MTPASYLRCRYCGKRGDQPGALKFTDPVSGQVRGGLWVDETDCGCHLVKLGDDD